MATSQHYSLRWNNYLRHITFAFDNLRTQDDFVDVTLCCDGRKIKAHKVLLSACSGYFKDIFKENPHPHPVIIFKFIKYEDLNAIIEFMYQGEVNVQQDALQSFLQTAELLAVQGLTSEEKEKPKSLKNEILEHETVEKLNLKIIPNTMNTVTEISDHSPAELQGNITNTVKKRKLIFSDGQENVYNEPGEYCKDDEQTFVKDIQFVQPTVKIDIPEYIDVQNDVEYDESNPMKKETSPENTTQTANQFTSEYEILTESEIDEKFQTRASEEISEINTVQIGPIFTTQPVTENGPDNTKTMCHDPASNKWTECQFCKMVITTVNLWRHIRTQHTPQPPRKCEICNKNFKNKYSLREHIRISHEHKQNI